MERDVIAIVLAGGRSQRMAGIAPAGGKASLPLGDDTMLARVCRVLAGEVSRVIVVAAEGQPLPRLPPSVEITRDTTPDMGPLAGIRDGLAYALATGPHPAAAIIASCDVPDLAAGVVRLLVEKAKASGASWVVPVVGGHPQVLISGMTASVFDVIVSATAAHLKSPRALLDAIRAEDSTRVLLLEETELHAFDPSLASFADIDTPEDFAKARASAE